MGGEEKDAVVTAQKPSPKAPHSIAQRIAAWLGWSLWAAVVPIGLAMVFLVLLFVWPERLCTPLEIGFDMPSEQSIPVPSPVRPIDPNDPQWRFRYAPTGTEFRAGIPYWIFRIMPTILPDRFGGGGWEHFGFDKDNADYYSNWPLPRGVALSDTEIYVPFAHVAVKLKRVSITCSGCHRGEYVKDGTTQLVDGMPNHTADLQAFKRFFETAFLDSRFTPVRVITEVNNALEHDKKPRLTGAERLVYEGIAGVLMLTGQNSGGSWMDKRADNGPGRIDPFNAVKFEVLGVPDDGTAATIDFPSIWNQRDAMRSWHHCDGNTRDSSARNFGSVIGVGGVALSVRKEDLGRVADWIDDLEPPRWPFTPPEPALVSKGAEVFAKNCAGCHGVYDRATNSMSGKGGKFMQVDLTVGTDPERWKAFREGSAKALNEFGERNALWGPNAFRGAPEFGDYGYLAGPLDGIWARAPYLHNGSVPTIAELLKAPAERVKVFYRGNPHYDETNVGWVSTAPSVDGRSLFRYCTVRDPTDAACLTVAGNSNQGHDHPVADATQRNQLLAYMKTL
jgi:hypothetical protein